MKYKFILFIPITAFIITSALAQDAVLPPTSRLELRKTGIVSITKDTSGKVRAIKLVVNHYDVKLDEYGKRLASMDGQEVSVNCSFSNEGGKRVVTVRDPQYQGEASGVSAQLLRKKGIISVTKNASGQVAAIRLIVNSYDIPLDEYSKQLTTMDGRKVRVTGTFSSEGGKRLFYVKSMEPVTAEGGITPGDSADTKDAHVSGEIAKTTPDIKRVTEITLKENVEFQFVDGNGATIGTFGIQKGTRLKLKSIQEKDVTVLYNKKEYKINISKTDYAEQVQQTSIDQATAKGDFAAVKQHLQNGADVNAKSTNGRTALMEAVWFNDLDMVKYLVGKGADINAEDDSGLTPLQMASLGSKWDVSKYLIDKGADVNKRSTNGATPLSAAAEMGKLDVVKFLIANGADMNARDEKNGNTLLMDAAINGNLVIATFLVDKGADVNARNNDGGTPLIWATCRGHRLEMIKFLLDKGADVNARANDGTTPLMLAAIGKDLNIVKYLVDKGADVNAKAKRGTTPLKEAATEGNRDVVEFLKQHGAKE